MQNDKLTKVHEFLKTKKVKGLPEDYGGFVEMMKTEKGQKVYNFLASRKIKGLPDSYDNFVTEYGLKKKDPEQSQGPSLVSTPDATENSDPSSDFQGEVGVEDPERPNAVVKDSPRHGADSEAEVRNQPTAQKQESPAQQPVAQLQGAENQPTTKVQQPVAQLEQPPEQPTEEGVDVSQFLQQEPSQDFVATDRAASSEDRKSDSKYELSKQIEQAYASIDAEILDDPIGLGKSAESLREQGYHYKVIKGAHDKLIADQSKKLALKKQTELSNKMRVLAGADMMGETGKEGVVDDMVAGKLIRLGDEILSQYSPGSVRERDIAKKIQALRSGMNDSNRDEVIAEIERLDDELNTSASRTQMNASGGMGGMMMVKPREEVERNELYDWVTGERINKPSEERLQQEAEINKQAEELSFRDDLGKIYHEKALEYLAWKDKYDAIPTEHESPSGLESREENERRAREMNLAKESRESIEGRMVQSKMDFLAIGKAYLTNRNVLDKKKDIAHYMTTFGENAFKSFLGETLGKNIVTGGEARDAIVRVYEENGVALTEEEKKMAERNFGEVTAETGGGLGGIIPWLGLSGRGVGMAARVFKIPDYLQKLNKSKKTLDKVKAHSVMALMEEGKTLGAGFDAGSGIGFYAAGKLLPFHKLFNKSEKPKREVLDMMMFGAQRVSSGSLGGFSGVKSAQVVESMVESIFSHKDFHSALDERGFFNTDEKHVFAELISFGALGVPHLNKKHYIQWKAEKYEPLLRKARVAKKIIDGKDLKDSELETARELIKDGAFIDMSPPTEKKPLTEAEKESIIEYVTGRKTDRTGEAIQKAHKERKETSDFLEKLVNDMESIVTTLDMTYADVGEAPTRITMGEKRGLIHRNKEGDIEMRFDDGSTKIIDKGSTQSEVSLSDLGVKLEGGGEIKMEKVPQRDMTERNTVLETKVEEGAEVRFNGRNYLIEVLERNADGQVESMRLKGIGKVKDTKFVNRRKHQDLFENLDRIDQRDAKIKEQLEKEAKKEEVVESPKEQVEVNERQETKGAKKEEKAIDSEIQIESAQEPTAIVGGKYDTRHEKDYWHRSEELSEKELAEFRALHDKITSKDGRVKKNAKKSDVDRYNELNNRRHIVLKPDVKSQINLIETKNFDAIRRLVDYESVTEDALKKVVNEVALPELVKRALWSRNATLEVLELGLKHRDKDVRSEAQKEISRRSIEQPITKNTGNRDRKTKEVEVTDAPKEPVREKPRTSEATDQRAGEGVESVELKTAKEQVEVAEKNVAAAKEALNKKRKELDEAIVSDQSDLFGERKSQQEGGLFDVRIEQGQRSKALEPLENKLREAEAELARSKEALNKESNTKRDNLFSKKPEVEVKEKPKPEEPKIDSFSDQIAKVESEIAKEKKVFAEAQERYRRLSSKKEPDGKIDFDAQKNFDNAASDVHKSRKRLTTLRNKRRKLKKSEFSRELVETRSAKPVFTSASGKLDVVETKSGPVVRSSKTGLPVRNAAATKLLNEYRDSKVEGFFEGKESMEVFEAEVPSDAQMGSFNPDSFVYSFSKNPAEIALEWKRLKDQYYELGTEVEIGSVGWWVGNHSNGFGITRGDWMTFAPDAYREHLGIRIHETAGQGKNKHNKSIDLAQTVEELREKGFQGTEQDIIDWVVERYDNNMSRSSQQRNPLVNDLEMKFEELTGFRLTDELVSKIEKRQYERAAEETKRHLEEARIAEAKERYSEEMERMIEEVTLLELEALHKKGKLSVNSKDAKGEAKKVDAKGKKPDTSGGEKKSKTEVSEGEKNSERELIYNKPEVIDPVPGTSGIFNIDTIIDLPGEFFGGIKRKAKKYLTPAGLLPKKVFAELTKMESKVKGHIKRVKWHSKDLRKAIRKHYKGRSITVDMSNKIDQVLKGDRPISDLPLEFHKPVEQMRNHIDELSRFMIDSGMVQGELKLKFEQNMGLYVTRAYEAYDAPAKWLKFIQTHPEGQFIKNRAISFIRDQFAQKGQNKSTAEIEGYIYEYLDSKGSPFQVLSSGKLGKMDLGILMKRGDIAPEIRALLGEYTDPLYNYARSISKMANLIERHKFLGDVKDIGLGKFLFEGSTPPDAKHYAKIAAKNNFSMKPVDGLYTTPEIKEAFDSFDPVSNGNAIWDALLRKYMALNGVAKSSKTVFSVMTHARNLVGNTGFALMNGHYRAGKMGLAIKDTWGDITTLSDVEFRDRFKKYVDLGIVDESTFGGEMRDIIEDAQRTSDFGKLMDSKASKLKRGALDKVVDLYQAEDNLWKIYAFHNEFSRYSKAYEGKKSKQEIERLAADIVRKTYPTYSLVPRGVRELRKFPIIGTFTSFPSEVIRTTYNTVELTKHELSNPETRKIGLERLAGIFGMITASSTASLMSAYVNNINKEQEDAMRRFMPTWKENSQLFHLGPVENGSSAHIDWGYSDPHSYLKKPFLALLLGEDTKESAFQAFKELASPFIGEEMLEMKIREVVSNKKTTSGAPVYNEADEMGTQIMKSWEHIWTGLEPGTISSARRIYKGAIGEGGKHGQVYDPRVELLATFSGQRIEKIEYAKQFTHKVNAASKELRNISMLYSEVLNMEGSVSKEKKDEAYKKADAKRKKVYEELHKDWKALKVLGVKDDEIVMRMNLVKFGKSNIKHVRQGTYPPLKIRHK